MRRPGTTDPISLIVVILLAAPSQLALARPAANMLADDDLGFQVVETIKLKKKRPAKKKATLKVSARLDKDAPKEVMVRLNAGMGLAWRRFLLDQTSTVMHYETSVYSQLFASGEIYPLHLVTRSALARLGLRLGYAHSAGLTTVLKDASLTTSMKRIWGGLNYILPRLSHPHAPRMELRLGLAQMGFDVQQHPQLSSLSVVCMAVGGSAVVPFTSFVMASVAGEYRMLVGARSPMLEPFQIKSAGLHGLSMEGGVQGKIAAGLGYRAWVTYEQLAGDLPALSTDSALRVHDWFASFDLALTYEM
jgi:hypothetical protein